VASRDGGDGIWAAVEAVGKVWGLGNIGVRRGVSKRVKDGSRRRRVGHVGPR
jgi:hypothetical protein